MKATKIILLTALLALTCNCSKQQPEIIATPSVESLLIEAKETIKELEAHITFQEATITQQQAVISMLENQIKALEADKPPKVEGIFIGIITVKYFKEEPWVGGSGITTIELKDGKYTCAEYSNNISGGGSSGTYTIHDDKIVFVNENGWLANFDWNLILDGEYDFTFVGTQLKISKENDYARYEYDLLMKNLDKI
jgi:uncharacterized coiled-coil protein SlyX